MSADISAAGAVIYSPKKDSFLLLKHRQGHWAFAQGKLEGDENIKAAAKREILEETGIQVKKLIDECALHVTYSYHHRKKKILKEVTFYLVVSNDPVTISSEHKGFVWVRYKQAMKLLKFKNHTNALKMSAEYLRNSGYRIKGL